MVKKSWEADVGEVTVAPGDTDELLSSKVSERKQKQIERAEERDEAKHKAEMAELKKKETVAETAVEKSGEKKEEPGGIKLKGEIDLGTYNPQEQQREALEEIKRLRLEADEAARATGQENMQLRKEIHEKEMELLQSNLDARLQLMTKLIESQASRRSFADEYKQSMEVAQLMGMVQPQAGADATTSIELKRLDFDNQMALRKLSREEKGEERRWQLELRRLDDDREHRKQELGQQAKRNEMFANLPQQVGAAIAAGLVESGGGSEISAPAKGKNYQIEAPVGKGGEMDCPQCNEVIGLGPTAKSAVCAKCGTKVTIKRVSQEAQPPPEPEEE